MNSQQYSDMYDAHYYMHDCGEAYERNEKWLGFFARIAGRIVSDIMPESVLDAGCAMGFLVEGLRKLDVEAFGVDVSEYAIENTHPSIRPHCWVASITESLPQKYDLIVSIEVLEHMPKAEAEKAIVNLCQYTDDILFSSTPFDYREVTHINVHAPEYWAELFFRQGFVRDVDFDASFLTPWAVRFRRKSEPIHRTVREYERKFWVLWKENVDLRDLSISMRGQVQNLEKYIANREVEYQDFLERSNAAYKAVLDQREAEQEQCKASLTKAQQDLQLLINKRIQLESSVGWGILKRLQRLRSIVAPPGSIRDQYLDKLLQIRQSLKGVFSHTREGTSEVSSKDAYQIWIADNEPTDENLARQRVDSQSFAYRPLISVIVPIYNPPPHMLREAIESVLSQTYNYWELCLVDGNSNVPGVASVLTEFTSREDPRIRLVRLEENRGISGNSNVALEMAQGDFVALLDHDDQLAPFAFFEIAQLLNQNPSWDFIYSDHDILTSDGRSRFNPLFKPDWSPEILLSSNYLTHLTVVRTDIIRNTGGFNSMMDGAQDWDLFFRITERTQKIAHISKVLYHWRESTNSTALNVGAKPYAQRMQLKAIENHLIRQGLQETKAFFDTSGFIRVAWAHSGKKVSIIIPSNGVNDLLIACVDSLLQVTAYFNYEVIIVNNGERRPEAFAYYKQIASDERVRVLHFEDSPFNYSAVNNYGAREADGDILLFLNNDTKAFVPEWLDELVLWTELQDVGVVGAKLLKPDGMIQHAGVILGLTGFAGHIFAGLPEGYGGIFGFVEWYRDFLAVTGACLMMRREVFEELGGFNQDFQLCGSDVELCLRVVAHGYRVVYTPFAKLFHVESATHQGDIPKQDYKVSLEYYVPVLEMGDPYFNSNLSWWHHEPSLSSKNQEQPLGFVAKFISENDIILTEKEC